jgi:hypothetical protein
MASMIARLLPSESIPAEDRQELRRKLDRFYSDAWDYTAFQEPSDQRPCWAFVKTQIQRLLAIRQGATVHVLEVGAGRSGFSEFLEESNLRSSVVLHAQDVTRFNEAWLTVRADFCYFGDVGTAGIPPGMDIVFSTYVIEHVTDPASHLRALWSLVSDGSESKGVLFLFGPRYDLPGYLCPSARHLPVAIKRRFVLQAFTSRIRTLLTGQPQFLIQTDLAAFHQPFFRDADAVHWASLFDLKAWIRAQAARSETLKIGSPAIGSKDWMIKRHCTLAVKLARSS